MVNGAFPYALRLPGERLSIRQGCERRVEQCLTLTRAGILPVRASCRKAPCSQTGNDTGVRELSARAGRTSRSQGWSMMTRSRLASTTRPSATTSLPRIAARLGRPACYSSDAPSGVLGRPDVWLLWRFADLAQPVCRSKDEPRPTCAIVHACSRVASRNGDAGYKLMRSSHATWTSTLNPPTTSIPRQTENQSSPFWSASIVRCSICQGRGPARLPDLMAALVCGVSKIELSLRHGHFAQSD